MEKVHTELIFESSLKNILKNPVVEKFKRTLSLSSVVILTGTVYRPSSSNINPSHVNTRNVSFTLTLNNCGNEAKKVNINVKIYSKSLNNGGEDVPKILHEKRYDNISIQPKYPYKCEGSASVTVDIHYDSSETFIRFEEYCDEEIETTVPESQMNLNLISLYEDDSMKDVKFMIGDEMVLAHKLIVSARNEYMKKMLVDIDMKEKIEGVVKITDCSMPVFKSFLRYLYTDEIENIKELAEDLIAVADKYGMECLKKRCENYLCQTINEDNIIRYLIEAHLYNCTNLKKALMCRMKSFIKDVYHLPEFKQLNCYPELLQDIIANMVESIKLL